MNYKEKILEHAIANAVTNALNFPEGVSHHVLGRDMSKTIHAVKEAVVGTGLYIIDNDYMLAHERATRVELIDDSGRAWVRYGVEEVTTTLQDDGRTLKLFLRG